MYVVPEMPASAWPLPGAASSLGSQDSCLLPGCHERAEAEREGTPLHLDAGQHNLLFTVLTQLFHCAPEQSFQNVSSFLSHRTIMEDGLRLGEA